MLSGGIQGYGYGQSNVDSMNRVAMKAMEVGYRHSSVERREVS